MINDVKWTRNIYRHYTKQPKFCKLSKLKFKTDKNQIKLKLGTKNLLTQFSNIYLYL